ncbi:MAG: S8 family serine peptidase, partial [Tissierellia bacterium]|nr:S8 family serine peptidase [Tissierellia bacterium]
MYTKFKKVMALVLILTLMIPSLAFADTTGDLEIVNDENRELYEKIVERGLQLRDKLKTKADVELGEYEDEYVRVIVELEARPAISIATDRGISYKELSLNERVALETSILRSHEEVKNLLKARKIDMTFERDFTVAFNGFSGTVKYRDLERIKSTPGVKNVYISQEYRRPEVDIDMKNSHEVVGSHPTWELGYKGEGMVIAIIDSGIDPSHKDFVVSEGTEVALTREDVESLVVPGKYFTEKVPYGYNYFDLNTEIRDLGPGASEHGMHVAGTAAANGNPEEGGIKGIAPEAQVLAMKVFSNDPTFGSTYDDIYLDAIDDAIKLGADVLNMSLGATAGFINYQSAVNKAITNAVENGIVCSISAGNSARFGDGWDLPYAINPDIGVVGSPGVSRDSLQVAGIENVRTMQNYLEYTITVEGDYEALPTSTIIVVDKAYHIDYLEDSISAQMELVNAINNGDPVYIKIATDMLVSILTGDVYTKLPADLPETVTYYDAEGNTSTRLVLGEGGPGETVVVQVPMLVSTSSPVMFSDVIKEPVDYVFCGIGTAADFALVDVRGKIALVQRGNTFTDTITNAEANGAIGVIVFNHASGGEELVNMAYPEGGTIPAGFIGHKGGMDLLKREGTTKISFPEGTISFPNPRAGYMYQYTSWGTTPNLELKPEITAPAVMIYSTLQNDNYGTMSGTSMAAPHVAGGAALVRQYIEQHEKYGDLTIEEKTRLAKVLLMNAADIIPNPDAGTPYSPRRQGAGVMNIHAAVTTPARVINPTNGEAKVELKDFTDTSFEFTLKVINDSDEDITYDVDVVVLADEIARGAGYYPFLDYITLNSRLVDAEVSGDGPVTVPANGEEEVTITVDFSGDRNIYENMFIEGFVIFKDTKDSHPTLSVPYVGFYGDWNAPKIFDGFRGVDFDVYYGLEEGQVVEETTPFYGYGGMIDLQRYFYNPVAMSPGTIFGLRFGTDTAIPVLSLLRNAEDIEYNILDESGNKLRTITRDMYVRKNYYDGGLGLPYNIRTKAAWDGTVRGNVVPDGKYYYEIRAKINYDNADYQSVRIPVYIDTQVPEVTNVKYDKDTKTVTWEATDGAGTGIQFFDILINGEFVFDDIFYPEDLLVEDNKYSLEILPLDLNDVHEIQIQAYDYAYNVGIGEAIVGNNVANIYLYQPEVLGIYDSNLVRFKGEVETPYDIQEVTVDGVPVTLDYDSSNGTYVFNEYLPYEDGYHEAVIAVKTTTGQEASIARMFWVDATPPELIVNGGEFNEEENLVTLNLTIRDNFPYAELYIDDSLVLLEDRMDRLSVIEPIGIVEEEFEIVLFADQTEIELRLVDFADNEVVEILSVQDLEHKPADKSQLKAKIEEAEKLEERLYTKESWEIFAQALADAKRVFENEEATQAEVDQALENLRNAIEGLVGLTVEEIITKIEGKYGTMGEEDKKIYVAYILFNIKEGFVETDEDVVVLIDGVGLEMKDGKEGYDYRFEGMLEGEPTEVIIKIGDLLFDVTELFTWN